MTSHLSIPLMLLALLAAPAPAHARAEAGTPIENVELRAFPTGNENLLSAKAKANVFVFFRTNQTRSMDLLTEIAACEKQLAGKPIHWAAVVSSSEVPEDVTAMVKESGIQMPVLVDEGDTLYDKLGVRLHPIVGIADGKGVLQALEPYRQLRYREIIKTRIKILLGEATPAQLEKVISPDRSPLPGADPMKKAMRDVNMARRLYEIGKYVESVKFAQRALAIAQLARAYTVMGQAYVKLGKCPEASAAFAEATKLDAKLAAAVDRGSCN